MIKEKYIELVRVEPGKKIHLKDYDTGWTQNEELKALGKDELKERVGIMMEQDLAELSQMQHKLYADDRYSLLIVFQGHAILPARRDQAGNGGKRRRTRF